MKGTEWSSPGERPSARSDEARIFERHTIAGDRERSRETRPAALRVLRRQRSGRLRAHAPYAPYTRYTPGGEQAMDRMQ